MKKMLLPLFAVTVCALLLSGCDSTPASQKLTADQEKVANELKDQLDRAKTTAQAAIDEAKKSADAAKDDVKNTITAAEKALTEAKTAVAAMRSGTGTFDDLKAKADTALKDLAAKMADLTAKVKLAAPAVPAVPKMP
jgi:outer membrane murein-binding lipoprotein Lpp